MSPTTRTFTRDQLDAWGLPHDCLSEKDFSTDPDRAVELRCEQVDTRRWVSVHELIFRAPDDGKAWAVTYEQGLTEVQEDHDPWNYDDTVTATLMEQHETTVTQWREVDPDRAEEQPAAVPVPAIEQRLAAFLADVDMRQFLTFALNCAAEEMDDRADEFDDDDEAALEALRRIATGWEIRQTVGYAADEEQGR